MSVSKYFKKYLQTFVLSQKKNESNFCVCIGLVSSIPQRYNYFCRVAVAHILYWVHVTKTGAQSAEQGWVGIMLIDLKVIYKFSSLVKHYSFWRNSSYRYEALARKERKWILCWTEYFRIRATVIAIIFLAVWLWNHCGIRKDPFFYFPAIVFLMLN